MVTREVCQTQKLLMLQVVIIDRRILFYCNNLDRLPPKRKFIFRNMKKRVQEKVVLAPADRATNNVVVV